MAHLGTNTMELKESQDLVCGHCSMIIGRLSDITKGINAAIYSHPCLMNSDNINIDVVGGKVYAGPISGTRSEILNTDNNSVLNTTPQRTHMSTLPAIRESTNTSEQWADNAVKLLINAYIEHKDKFDNPNFPKKKVWSLISHNLMSQGVIKSGPKCDEKWRNLKKTYDRVKSHLSTTGSNRIDWKFFEDFHNIYFKDPYFEPVAVASSSGVKRKLEDTFSIEGRNLSPGENKKPKKAITQLEIENRKQKRHEEKMKLKREMFEWLKDNYSKKD